jgi:cytochrome P450
MIEDADRFIIDRLVPRKHLSFGFGIHRCFGERPAGMRLRIFWEEMLQRVPELEIIEPPERVYSVFVKGYRRQMVRIPS